MDSLWRLNYPRDSYRVVVVADNCADRTAEVARRKGAIAIERSAPERSGKGWALNFGFEYAMRVGFADAVVVVDADTVVAPTMLRAFDQAIRSGGEAMQAVYLVRNSQATWLTRLTSLGFTMFNELRALARERLGLSVGLRGNGMCLTCDLLVRNPPHAFSVVEDVEYGLQLGLEGTRVQLVSGARVFGEIPTTMRSSGAQRQRWEGGRAELRREVAWPLLRLAARKRSVLLLDLAVDLLVPPLSNLALVSVLGAGGALVLALLGGGVAAMIVWCMSVGCLALYALRGIQLSGHGFRIVGDLTLAPLFVAWKVVLHLMGALSPPTTWARTERKGEGR